MASQLGQGRAQAQLNYAFIYSGGASGFNSSGAVPAIAIAEDMVRANTTIMARYNLTSRPPLDSRVNGLLMHCINILYMPLLW